MIRWGYGRSPDGGSRRELWLDLLRGSCVFAIVLSVQDEIRLEVSLTAVHV